MHAHLLLQQDEVRELVDTKVPAKVTSLSECWLSLVVTGHLVHAHLLLQQAKAEKLINTKVPAKGTCLSEGASSRHLVDSNAALTRG